MPDSPIPPTPSLPQTPQSTSPDLNTMLAFMKEENERNRVFFKDRFKESRNFLVVLLVSLGAPIGFVGWKTIHDATAAAGASANQAVRERLDMLKPKIDQQIRDNVQAEFDKPSIDKLVQNSADDATQKLAEPLIRSEIERRVQSAVTQQRSVINTTLRGAAKEAVQQVQGNIQANADAAVKQIVASRIDPQLAALSASSEEELAFSQAKAYDAFAFERLTRMATNTSMPNGIRQKAELDRSAILQSSDTFGAGTCFYSKDNFEAQLRRLASSEPKDYMAATGCVFPALAEGHQVSELYPLMEHFFVLATTAPDLRDRSIIFNIWSAIAERGQPSGFQKPRQLDVEADKTWWTTNRYRYVGARK